MKMLWAVLIGVFAVFVLYPLHEAAPVGVPSQTNPVVHRATAPKVAPVIGEMVLTRAANGHFYADGKVNGADIRFIVDTGATTVALSRADATKAGLTYTDSDFTGTARGASGGVAFKPVKLDRVSLGTLEATNVDAAIIKGDLDVSLLGQSWLKQVGTVSISGDTMTLR